MKKDGIRSGADIAPSERRAAFVWLALFGLLSAFIEVVYLGTAIELPDGKEIPIPISVLGAFFFNAVLTKTAARWTERRIAWLLPLAAWAGGIALAYYGPEMVSGFLTDNKILAISLLVAGPLGAFWPLARAK